MDDFRRPLDRNSNLTLGRDPKSLHNGFSCLVSHLSSLRFLIEPPVMSRSNMTWQIDLDSHLMNPSTKQSLCTLGQMLTWNEIKWRNAISRDAIKFQTSLWSIQNVQKNECELSDLKGQLIQFSCSFKEKNVKLLLDDLIELEQAIQMYCSCLNCFKLIFIHMHL